MDHTRYPERPLQPPFQGTDLELLIEQNTALRHELSIAAAKAETRELDIIAATSRKDTAEREAQTLKAENSQLHILKSRHEITISVCYVDKYFD